MSENPESMDPGLKPGLESTTFWMTVVMVGGLVTNSILRARGLALIDISPELTMGLASILTALYVTFRHTNRMKVNREKTDIAIAKTGVEIARIEAAATPGPQVCPHCGRTPEEERPR